MEEHLAYIDQHTPLNAAKKAPLFNLSEELEHIDITQQGDDENHLWELSMFTEDEIFATPTRANGYISNKFRTTNSRQLPQTITVPSTYSPPISSSTIFNASEFNPQPRTETYGRQFSHQYPSNGYPFEYFELPMNYREIPSIHGPVLVDYVGEPLYPERCNPSFGPNPNMEDPHSDTSTWNISQEDSVGKASSYLPAPILIPPTPPEKDTHGYSPLTPNGSIIHGAVNGNIPRPPLELWDDFVPNYSHGSDNVRERTPSPILGCNEYNHSKDDASELFEYVSENRSSDLVEDTSSCFICNGLSNSLAFNSGRFSHCDIDNNFDNGDTHVYGRYDH